MYHHLPTAGPTPSNRERKPRHRRCIQQYANAARSQVRFAVTVEVARYEAGGRITGADKAHSCGKCAVTFSSEHFRVDAVIVGDSNVKIAIPGEVCQRDRSQRRTVLGRIILMSLKSAIAISYQDTNARTRARHNQVLVPIPVNVPYDCRERLVADCVVRVRPERAVAVS